MILNTVKKNTAGIRTLGLKCRHTSTMVIGFFIIFSHQSLGYNVYSFLKSEIET